MQTLFDLPTARPTDPATSHEAASSVRNVRESQQLILKALDIWRRTGLTDEQIYDCPAICSYMSPSGARTRRSELVRQGLVVDSGERRKTKAGRQTIVWKAVSNG